ncbi:hypothetical protein [Herbaspirillum rubrisubalbicans]|uniref:hypothetical protein n=1 Tax=Herbaspirillum rubrisubalbicans TaxID=80842 RepID=UPI00209F1008|nr:hypothetical protein [Herbaspirillum rubrisubalbicans]
MPITAIISVNIHALREVGALYDLSKRHAQKAATKKPRFDKALTGSAQNAGLSRSQYRSTGANSEAFMVCAKRGKKENAAMIGQPRLFYQHCVMH